VLAIILFATEKLSVDVITLLPSEIVAWTKPWWALARHAAQESKRLGMEFGVFNGPGYETSDGPAQSWRCRRSVSRRRPSPAAAACHHAYGSSCRFVRERLNQAMRLLLLLSVLFSIAARAAGKPNVLFILCDDLRPQALGCYGSPHVKTPHIDRLAKEGVRFANAFCTTSLCSPSRASLLTGLYAHQHGVVNNFTELPPALPHWPARLHDTGYATAYIGKWHMGEENDAPRPGFDWFVTHKGQGKYMASEWNVNGGGAKVIPGYYTTVVTDLALDWLKKQDAKKPWALCVGHKAPHSFYTPEEKYARAFDSVRVPYPDTAFALDGKPAWIKQRLSTWHGIHGPLFEWRKKFPDSRPEAVKDFENMVHGYWGTILSVDDSVGRMREFLEKSGQLDRTLIVFLGDNGLLEGEHGMVDKRTAHEPCLRIPIIARGGGLPAGKVESRQVLTVDLPPSLLELTGAKELEKIAGKSWVKLVREGDPAWRTGWLYHYNYEKQFPYTPNVRALRTDRWKYIRYPHGPRFDSTPDKHLRELYDLRADPEERKNLINDPAQAATIAALDRQLLAEMAALGLAPATDTMPEDAGIKAELPDQKIR
jgi:N-acetylglucosamine-6-sulfatase